MRNWFRLLTFALVLSLCGIVVVVPVAAQDDMDAAHRETGLRIAEFFNAGDAEVLLEITADDYLHHGPLGDFTAEQVIGTNALLRGTIPDGILTAQVSLSDGDLVAVRWLYTGVMSGDFMMPDGTAVPANNADILVEIHHIYRFNADGEIAETWEALDFLNFLTQLGAVPAQEGAMMPMVEMEAWEVMTTGDDAEAQLRAGITDVVERAFNQGDMTAIDEAMSPDYISYPEGGDLEAFKASASAFRAAMPDYSATADPIVVEGNIAAMLFSFSGTFSEPLEFGIEQPIPPTGEVVNAWGIIFLVGDDEGRIAAEYEAFDYLGLLTQLGVIPSA